MDAKQFLTYGKNSGFDDAMAAASPEIYDLGLTISKAHSISRSDYSAANYKAVFEIETESAAQGVEVWAKSKKAYALFDKRIKNILIQLKLKNVDELKELIVYGTKKELKKDPEKLINYVEYSAEPIEQIEKAVKLNSDSVSQQLIKKEINYLKKLAKKNITVNFILNKYKKINCNKTEISLESVCAAMGIQFMPNTPRLVQAKRLLDSLQK